MDERTQSQGGMCQGGYLRTMHDSSYIVRMSDLNFDYETLRYRLHWFSGNPENNKKRFMIMQLAQLGKQTYAEIVEAKELTE